MKLKKKRPQTTINKGISLLINWPLVEEVQFITDRCGYDIC